MDNNCKETHPDYVEGYMDGYNLDVSEPGNNRSARYKHSFAIGRAEKLGKETPHYSVSNRRVEMIEMSEMINEGINGQ